MRSRQTKRAPRHRDALCCSTPGSYLFGTTLKIIEAAKASCSCSTWAMASNSWSGVGSSLAFSSRVVPSSLLMRTSRCLRGPGWPSINPRLEHPHGFFPKSNLPPQRITPLPNWSTGYLSAPVPAATPTIHVSVATVNASHHTDASQSQSPKARMPRASRRCRLYRPWKRKKNPTLRLIAPTLRLIMWIPLAAVSLLALVSPSTGAATANLADASFAISKPSQKIYGTGVCACTRFHGSPTGRRSARYTHGSL